MAARIITPEDLLEFKQELFQELQKLFATQNSSTLQKKWLKSPEVRELLGISPGTQVTRAEAALALRPHHR